MMLIWKKNIFIIAIKARMDLEQKTAEEIIEDYVKLTAEEKIEILNSI